jgi:hypothetical protein
VGIHFNVDAEELCRQEGITYNIPITKGDESIYKAIYRTGSKKMTDFKIEGDIKSD